MTRRSPASQVVSAPSPVPSAEAQRAAQTLADELDTAFFKALSEPARIALLRSLLAHGGRDIDAIAATFPQDRSVISRHLAVLRDVGLLHAEREGRHVRYRVDGRFAIEKLERLLTLMREALHTCCPPEP